MEVYIVMKKTIQFIVIFLALTMASSGFCQIRPETYSITPFFGGYTFEGNQNLQSQFVYGLRGGYDFTKHFGAEVLLDHIGTTYAGSDSNTNTDVLNYRLEGLYYFIPENRIVPFISVGAGGQSMHYDVDTHNKTRFVADYGAGVKCFINDWIALRADVRHVIAFGSAYNNLEYTLGLSFMFGGEKTAQSSAKESESSSSLASAKESSSDIKTEQKKEGEEATAVVKEQKKEAAAPATIVKEEEQKETAKEAAAVAAVAKEMVEKGRAIVHIRFDFDKADVKPEFHKEIEKFAKVMEQHKELKVVIEGHTDNIGEKDYNQNLSERRANSVRTYLIKKFGVEESRLTSKGYGLSKPIATNKTKEGRRKNRRVEAVVDYTITK
jgi:OmpA-OmpF porin, OOP family